MRIGIVSATLMEVIPLQEKLKTLGAEEKEALYFKYEDLEIFFLVSGIGIAHTSLYLGHLLAKTKFNLLINVGIAGAYDKTTALGTVFNIVKDSFGDLGAEDDKGQFLNLQEMGLITETEGISTFTNPAVDMQFLPRAVGLTLNKTSGFQKHIDQLKAKQKADVESMEGAAFAMACHLFEQDYLQIRSISNHVASRDRSTWDIPLALNQLTSTLADILSHFSALKNEND